MRTWLKLLIGLVVVGAGVAALIYLTRRKTNSTPEVLSAEKTPALASKLWAVSDALQQSQLTSLTGQLSDKVTRDDVAQMIQQALTSLPPTGSAPTQDVDLIARFNARYKPQ